MKRRLINTDCISLVLENADPAQYNFPPSFGGFRSTSMPIYEYQCSACGHRLEVIQRYTDALLKKCPDCGKARLKKLMSVAGFRLSGKGWYETDFKNNKQRNLAQKDSVEEKKSSKSGGSGEEKKSARAGESGGEKQTTSAKPKTATALSAAGD